VKLLDGWEGDMKRLGWLVAGVAMAAMIPGPGAAQTMDALYEAAKKEGALVLVGGGPAPPYEKFAREFMQRFPGIDVKVTGGPSNVHAEAIDKQFAARALSIDLAMLQTVQDFERWKVAGALTPFKPDGFDKVDAAWKDADGAYVGVQVSGLVYAYNTQKVSAAPRTALDFLKPEFKGGIITTFPHVDDVTLYLYSIIVEKHGWEFLDRLKANEPSFVRGHLGVSRAIASGEKSATFDAVAREVQQQSAEGKPIAMALSETEPMPVWAQSAGVFKDAPHPNAAKLFIAWYLQPDQQKRVGHWPSRSDVPPPEGLKPLSSYNLANAYRSFIMDEARAKTLRERYLKFTGPVIGSGTYR
jgi:ABC-type Fe3+ transport system substrate-binding protein